MRPVCTADSLQLSCADRLELWDFQPTRPLWAYPGLYSNCFFFFAITPKPSMQFHIDIMVMGYTENIAFKLGNTVTGQKKTN